MKVLINGLYGHMGRKVANLALQGYRGAELIAGVDVNCQTDFDVPCVTDIHAAETEVDCIIDFSHHDCIVDLLDFAVSNKIPLIVATTGHTSQEQEAIALAAKEIPIFYTANYSVGIALLIEFAKKTIAVMPEAEIEIIEKHHNRKLDAPSGTALAIANAIQEVRSETTINCGRHGQGKRIPEEIGISSVRMGNIVGEHEVIIGTPNQTITLKHEAHNRTLFAEGALTAAEFLCGKPAGLYNMKDMISF